MKSRLLIRLLCLSLLLSLQPGLLVAQDDDTRGIWDSGFRQKRQKSSNSTAKKSIKYHRTTPKVFTSVEVKPTKPEDLQSDKGDKAVVGLTFWKLRRSVKTDDKAVRMLERVDDKDVELTPERVESDTLFAPGDMVRLSFESPRDGYLYVINREQYSGGKVSDPVLIFPTLRDYDGNNRVTAGRVIEIPRKAKFTLSPKNPAYEGEILTFIVSPKPLDGITAAPRELELDDEQVKKWETMWSSAKIEKYELDEGKGKVYTKAEKEAGETGTRLLTQDDDMPQTLFVLDSKPNTPILFTLHMKLRK